MGVWALVQTLSFLPWTALDFLSRLGGEAAYLLLRKRRKVALANITQAYGDSLSKKEKNGLARSAFRHIALSLVELFLVHKLSKHPERHFKIDGAEYFQEAHRKGKGVVFVVSHLGAWEYLSFTAHFTPQKIYCIVKEIRNPYLDQMIKGFRREMKMEPIFKVNSIREVMRQLKRNQTVAVLIDQWAGDEGLWADFFGLATSTTSIPYRLAARTGAAMIEGYCIRQKAGQYEIRLKPPVYLNPEDPLEERRVTEQLNRNLEEQIKQFPGQWTWTHRRWKPKPDSMRET